MTFTTRLFLGAVAILLVSTSVLLVAADRWLRRDLDAALAHEVERDARLIAAAIGDRPRDLNEVAHRYGAILGRRVSLIDSAGRVVGDSDFDDASLALLENHRDRPEIEAAFAGEVGVDSRLSASTNRRELKIAVAGWPGVVRVSAPLAQVDAVIHAAQQSVLLAALVALLFGMLWAAVGGRRIGRPLAQVGRAAQALSRGEPVDLPASGIPEIRQMVQSLRSMDADLRSRMLQLRHEREESAALIESMVEGVLATDRDGTVVACNPAARRLLSYAPDQPLPNVRGLFHDRRARTAVEQALAGQTVEERETELEGRVVIFTGRPLPRGGALLVMRDITALKRMEAMRTDFVANASHELKTPLTSISGYAATLLETDVAHPDQRRFLEVIEANARRMQRMVDDLLDLARLESGRWQPDIHAVNLAEVVRDAWAPLADQASVKQVELQTHLAPDLAVAADRTALVHMLANLFENALRHASPGGTITVLAHPDEGGNTSIHVRDTGSGIPESHLPRIFERFYRVDPGRSRDAGGTGLGLAIVKHLAEAHGGSVRAESRLGAGTTMIIGLPARNPDVPTP